MIRQIASRLFSRLLLGFVVAVVFCGPLASADEPEKDKEKETQREQGLKNMRRSAAQYTLSSSDAPERAFKFDETAAMRPRQLERAIENRFRASCLAKR